jgi:YHS domain-containing protein
MHHFKLLLLLGAMLGVLPGIATADAPTEAQLKAAAATTRSVNGLCPVLGNLVTTAGGAEMYKGEKVAFCCVECAAKFRADPTRYMDRMRLNPRKYWYITRTPPVVEMRAAKQALQSANGRCPVMGKTVVARGGASTYKGQKIQFCCPPCKVKFDKDPERYMRLMRADPLAYAYSRPGPTNTQMRVARTQLQTVNGRCPVMGKLVVAKGGSIVHAGQKIGFCCPPCLAKFQRDPAKFMKRMTSEPASYGYVAPAR